LLDSKINVVLCNCGMEGTRNFSRELSCRCYTTQSHGRWWIFLFWRSWKGDVHTSLHLWTQYLQLAWWCWGNSYLQDKSNTTLSHTHTHTHYHTLSHTSHTHTITHTHTLSHTLSHYHTQSQPLIYN
jgi:hypothetical protein